MHALAHTLGRTGSMGVLALWAYCWLTACDGRLLRHCIVWLCLA